MFSTVLLSSLLVWLPVVVTPAPDPNWPITKTEKNSAGWPTRVEARIDFEYGKANDQMNKKRTGTASDDVKKKIADASGNCDDAIGHIVPARWGGRKDIIENVYAQDKKINNGDWKREENLAHWWFQNKKNIIIYAVYTLDYDPKDQKRPTKITGEYTVKEKEGKGEKQVAFYSAQMNNPCTQKKG